MSVAPAAFDVSPPRPPRATDIRVPLSESEATAATAVAEREGLSRARWIAKLVRMVAANAVEPSPSEMNALVQATAEMRSLVVALSRLARALERASAGETDDAPSLADLSAITSQLGARLDAHAETTATALRASHERWPVTSARNG